MKHLFVVFDEAAGEVAGNVVWIMAAPIVAVRQFQEIAANKDSTVAKYPADHVLYQIGLLEGKEITLLPEWSRLGSAAELNKEAPTNG